MCGILFTLSCSTRTPAPSHASLISLRGPDSTRTHTVGLSSSNKILTFTSSLLSVRGSEPTFQPLIDASTGSVLCWNGEAWRIHGDPISPGVSDTRAVFELLLSAPEGRVEEVLGSIDGEFAFVFYDAFTGICWFGRDWAGRRSLVMRVTREGELEVASVGDGISSAEDSWKEVEVGGVWRLDAKEGKKTWVAARSNRAEIYTVPTLNMTLPTSSKHPSLTMDSPEVTSLHQSLIASLRLRVQDIQLPPDPDLHTRPTSATNDDVRLAVLFSGGVDCTTISRIAHDILPPGEPVDLLNVAFENPRIIAARSNPGLLLKQGNAKKKKGQDINPAPPSNGQTPAPTTRTLPLSNLDPYTLCPDRTTGLSSFRELCEVCPTRPWRFISINVPYTEVLAHRSTVISLMHPHNTEMDLSIALAFYFASRGHGDLLSSGHVQKAYTTPARILLSGLGADELLGGYTRHATAYRRTSYSGLLAELDLDFQRLGKRNLGRDDRVVAHWAKEVRYPFLDETVVAWAMATPVQSKCPFGDEEDGVENGKKVLRLLAKKLGMSQAAEEAKRAVQFGARSAKMSIDSRKMKGTDGLLP